MNLIDIVSTLFLIIGLAFFIAGTLGLLRFPDVYTRLHALTKADNLGLGFIIIGISFQLSSIALIIKLVIIWLLVMLAGSSVAYLIAKGARKKGIAIWKP